VTLARLCSDACIFVGTDSFSGTIGEVRYELIDRDGQAVTELSVDIDGDGIADFAVDLLGSHTLTTTNVLFR
jgi:hypothetical protein